MKSLSRASPPGAADLGGVASFGSGNHETVSLCFGFILRWSERSLRDGR